MSKQNTAIDSIFGTDGTNNRLTEAGLPAQPQAEGQPTDTDPDPFDPASIVLDQSYLKTATASRVLLEVNVRKPKDDEFFRVHSDPAYSLGPIATITTNDGRDIYVLDPALAKAEKLKHAIVTFQTCINLDGVLFLWPVTVPGSSGRSPNAWHTSAVKLQEAAQLGWVKRVINEKAGNYEAFPARGVISEPDWPELGFKEILKLALKNRYITSRDHPVLRKKDGIL